MRGDPLLFLLVGISSPLTYITGDKPNPPMTTLSYKELLSFDDLVSYALRVQRKTLFKARITLPHPHLTAL